MAKSKEDIINDIVEHFGLTRNSKYSRYNIGITNDINRRLFTEHAVDKDKDAWIYRTANSKFCAQEVEEYFLDLGMDGDTGGGKDDTIIVYCYMMNEHTNP